MSVQCLPRVYHGSDVVLTYVSDEIAGAGKQTKITILSYLSNIMAQFAICAYNDCIQSYMKCYNVFVMYEQVLQPSTTLSARMKSFGLTRP